MKLAEKIKEAVEGYLDPMGHDPKELLRVIQDCLPTKDEERIERASHYLCELDDLTIAEQLALIDAQAEINDQVMLDHVEDVIVWEKVEYSFTVSSFLDEVTPL
jgi:hypothetical protein